MKPLRLLLIFSLFASLTINAQNWSLVMPNDTLVYEREDVYSHLMSTVWVDSVGLMGVDTIYYMNRIVSNVILTGGPFNLCDSVNYNNIMPYAVKKSLTKPQFCGDHLIVTNAKTIINSDLESFVLYPQNPIGSSWVCDSVSMDIMQVIDIDTSFIISYQVMDSVKVLKFRNDSIIISKNHGIIKGFGLGDSTQMKFNQIGVQNLELGVTIPMGMDFYDFEVGDVFYRKQGVSESDGSQYNISKTRIISKNLSGDTIIYSVEINSRVIYYDGWSGSTSPGPSSYSQATHKYWPEMNPFLNAMPNTLQWMSNLGTNVNVFVQKVENDRIQKSNYNTLSPPFGICTYDSFMVEYGVYGPSESYIEGVGNKNYSFSYGYHNEFDYLIGYLMTDGSSWGDTTFTSISEIDYSNFIHFYPNPTNDYLTIEIENLNGTHVLEMYDLQGRLMVTNTFETHLKLDVSIYSRGIYFAIIKDIDGDVLYREKVVVN